MQLFQICGNFSSSWIPFSPSLKQVQFLPIPSIGQKTQTSQWLQQAVKKSAQWLSSASFFLGSRVSFLHLEMIFITFTEFKPFVKLIQNSQKVLLEEIYWKHGRKRIKEEKEDGATE